ESTCHKKDCALCRESSIKVGGLTGYGAKVIFRIGRDLNDGWFATLSPKTGGDPEKDFTIQLMPFAHLTHFCQLFHYPGIAKNYGVAFSMLSNAMARVMALESKDFDVTVVSRDSAVSIAVYGKSTNWIEKKEHLHIKLFPFRENIGQPYTVDSSFGKKQVFKDSGTGEAFVRMLPVKKVFIEKNRFEGLSAKLVEFLAGDKND
ncbi:MAG: hypothetical protein JW772_03990, partial [Candidatus Diapherotrites archaeon]|nr:hypothetical protein [Candidatus Diapherotrites archaeon]